MLKGWQATFDSIGMLLLFFVPWADVTDTYGRRPVLLIIALALFAKYSYIQFICDLGGAVPLKFTWLSSLHTIFGGSVTIGTALICTIISDVLPEQQRLASFIQVQASLIACHYTLIVQHPIHPARALRLLLQSMLTAFIHLLGLHGANWCTDGPNDPLPSCILSDTRIVLIVAIFSVHMLFLNRDLILQYISSRYQVTLVQATALVSIRSGLAFLLS
ncbi:hypothetical protein V8F33_009794 [Rhypophila sp. PSN 637]